MYAAEEGHLQVVTELVSRGAAVDLKDERGQTAYDKVVQNETMRWQPISEIILMLASTKRGNNRMALTGIGSCAIFISIRTGLGLTAWLIFTEATDLT